MSETRLTTPRQDRVKMRSIRDELRPSKSGLETGLKTTFGVLQHYLICLKVTDFDSSHEHESE